MAITCRQIMQYLNLFIKGYSFSMSSRNTDGSLVNPFPVLCLFLIVHISVVQAEKQHQNFVSGIEHFLKEELKHTDPNVKSVMPDASGKFST